MRELHLLRHAKSSWDDPAVDDFDRPLAALNTTVQPTNVEAMQRYVPSFTVDTIDGVGHGGILLRRVEDFDARLLAIVERFASLESESS